MLSLKQKKDKLIRATDLDALSCRLSANAKGYFNPPDRFIPDLLQSYELNLQYCDGYTELTAGRTLRTAFKEPKFPLINRGTFCRTEAINKVVLSFVAAFPKSQIVSLGGGSDTRCFRVLEETTTVTYMEIDFPESAKIKKIAIAGNPRLQSILGTQLPGISVSFRAELAAVSPDVHSEKYHLIGLDLRNVEENSDILTAHLDAETPTLVISECVLCYLTPHDNEAVLNFWKRSFSCVSVVMYEPMGLNDAFGHTMAQNLINRGIDLHTFQKYPDLESRRTFFAEKLGFSSVKLTDMARIAGYTSPSDSWIAPEELRRVSALEMIDEVEEIKLLLHHYCLIYAGNGEPFEQINHLKWLH